MKNEVVCAEIESSLPLYVGGDLEPAALAEVRAHIATCAPCSAAARAALAARTALVSALRLEGATGPDLWSGVRAVLRDEGLLAPKENTLERAIPSAARARRAPVAWRLWSAAAAAIVLGFVVGALWNRNPSETFGTPPIVENLGPRTPHEPITVLDPGVGVVPVVSNEVGLRRLAPSELGLREEAQSMYDTSTWIQDLDRGSAGMAPVNLQRIGPQR